jgi:hypothetical protein
MFVFSVIRLLSRRCHKISSIPQLLSCPSQNRTSGFPTYGSSVRLSVAGSQIIHITDVMILTGMYQFRLFARFSPIHFSFVATDCHPLHDADVSLPWSTHRGNLRSAGISRFIARPLRHSGSHHLRRGHPTTSFYIGRGTRVLPLQMIPQELLDRRSPG